MFRAIFEFTNMRAIVTILDEFYDTSDNWSCAEYNISEWGNAEWDECCKHAEYNVSEWSTVEWNEGAEDAECAERAEYNVSEWSTVEWNEGAERADYNVAEWNNIGWSEQHCSEQQCRVLYSVPNAAANLSALFYYVNMRATYDLVSPNFDGGDVGGSRFDSRAIDEWTFNG